MVTTDGLQARMITTTLSVVAVIPPIYEPRLTSGEGRTYNRSSVLEDGEQLTQAGVKLFKQLLVLPGVTQIRVSDNTSIGGRRAVEFVFTLDLGEVAVHNSIRDLYIALAAATVGTVT